MKVRFSPSVYRKDIDTPITLQVENFFHKQGKLILEIKNAGAIEAEKREFALENFKRKNFWGQIGIFFVIYVILATILLYSSFILLLREPRSWFSYVNSSLYLLLAIFIGFKIKDLVEKLLYGGISSIKDGVDIYFQSEDEKNFFEELIKNVKKEKGEGKDETQ